MYITIISDYLELLEFDLSVIVNIGRYIDIGLESIATTVSKKHFMFFKVRRYLTTKQLLSYLTFLNIVLKFLFAEYVVNFGTDLSAFSWMFRIR